MRPYMTSAAILAIISFTLIRFLIPPSNSNRNESLNKYYKNKEVTYARNNQLMVEPEVIAYLERYDSPSKTGFRFSLEKFDNKKLISRLTAKSIQHDSLYNWKIKDYMIRRFNGMEETIEKGTAKDTIIKFEPSDILISKYDFETMTTPQLKEYITKQKERGVANIIGFEIEYYNRFAMMGAAFILTAIGMALSSRKVKGGMGINIGIGLGLSFSYILFTTITATFAVTGQTSPLLAVWIPNILYSFIAIYLYIKAPK